MTGSFTLLEQPVSGLVLYGEVRRWNLKSAIYDETVRIWKIEIEREVTYSDCSMGRGLTGTDWEISVRS